MPQDLENDSEKIEFRRVWIYGKKRWIPGRRSDAGEYGESDEAGAEDAASDGRAGEGNGDKGIQREGGAVEATVSGTKQLMKISLDEEVVDPEDIEMLEDLIVAAVNEALEKVDEASASAMSKFTGGMGGQIPGLF